MELPLPQPAPAEFTTLPEWFVEDIIDLLTILSRFNPPVRAPSAPCKQLSAISSVCVCRHGFSRAARCMHAPLAFCEQLSASGPFLACKHGFLRAAEGVVNCCRGSSTAICACPGPHLALGSLQPGIQGGHPGSPAQGLTPRPTVTMQCPCAVLATWCFDRLGGRPPACVCASQVVVPMEKVQLRSSHLRCVSCIDGH